MSPPFEILAVRRMSKPLSKAEIFGDFDVSMGGLILRGCALVRYRNGNICAWLPLSRNKQGIERGVRFADPAVQRDLTREAFETYRAAFGPPDFDVPAYLGNALWDASGRPLEAEDGETVSRVAARVAERGAAVSA